MGIWIRGATKCPICEQILNEGEVVSFWHFIGDDRHPLWRFSDSTMHRDCFREWRHRKEFAELHNAFFLRHPRADGRCRHICEDGTYVWLDPRTGDRVPWE